MYSFSIKSRTKISTSLVPDSRVKVKATELRFHFSIGSVSKRQRWGHFEEAQAGISTNLFVFALADTIICDQPHLIGGGDVPLRQWKRHSLTSEILVSMSFPPRLSSGLCAHHMSPRCWGGVYWWHCLPFHIHNSSQIKSAPVLLNPTVSWWANNLFHAKEPRTWLERSYFLGVSLALEKIFPSN